MKDKEVRKALDSLADRLGYGIEYFAGIIPPQAFYDVKYGNINAVGYRLSVLEDTISAMKESAKPVCTNCGQKIQEGFKAGQLEELAATLPSGKRTKK